MSGIIPYEHKLPTLSELQLDLEKALQSDKLNLLLNQPCPESWVKKNKFVTAKDANGRNVESKYLPIDKVEYLLLRIFGRWRREIISVTQTANSVMAIVRLHVLNPVTQEWDWHDGIGAVPIQQDSGASATDVNAIKKNAIQIAAPSAVTYALKNAAERLGSIFGRDLDKPNALQYTGALIAENAAAQKDLEDALQQNKTEGFISNPSF